MRERNGWVDDGSLIKASNRLDRCPNCGSSNYRETISMEKCEACGLVCDYWGGGTNEVYNRYLANHYAAQERAAEERRAREDEEERRAWQVDDDPDY